MDNKVIEELDIIIRAQVDKARGDLKKIAKETKTVTDSIVKDFKKVDNSDALSGMTKAIKNSVEETKKAASEMKHQIEVTMDNVTFKMSADTSDFNEKYEEAMAKYEEEVSKLESKEIILPEVDTTSLNDVKASLNNLKDASATTIEELEYNLQNFNALSLADEIKTVGMQIGQLSSNIKQSFNNTSFGQAVTNAIEGWKMGFDIIKSKASEFKNVLNNSSIGQSVTKSIDGWKSGFDTVKQKITSMKSTIGDFAGNVKSKVEPVTNIFKNIGTTAKNAFVQAKANIKEMANTAGTPLNKLKGLINKIKDVRKESENTKKAGNSLGKSFESGIKSIKKFGLSLLSVRGMFNVVSQAAQSYLSFDTQLQSSIQNSWNVLGSLLAPALEFVASLFSQITSAVALFVKTLTGVDLVAKANAKALKKQEDATKGVAAANKQLSSIDDIETLSSSSGNSESNKPEQLTIEPIDISPMMNVFNKLKGFLGTLFDPIIEAWENVGSGVFDSMIEMFESLGGLGGSILGSIFEVWTNGTGEEIITNILLGFQGLFDIIGLVADALKKAWDTAGTGTSIIQKIADTFIIVEKFVLSIEDTLKKWVMSESFQEALSVVLGFVDDLLGYIEDIADWILEMYNKYFKPVIEDKLLPAINDIIIAVGDIWKAVKPVVDKVISNIKNFLEPVIKGLSGLIGGIIDVIDGIAKFVSGVFKGDWQKAWDGIKKIFQGIWDAIASVVKTPINLILAGIESFVNALIDGFNFFKKAINKISFDVPDWVPVIGGEKWGFNLKLSDPIKLPRLATGDVAYEETQVVVGEYANARQNPEIISPKSMMEDAFRNVLDEKDEGTRVDKLIINVADKNFYEGAIEYINNESARKGVSVIKETS